MLQDNEKYLFPLLHSYSKLSTPHVFRLFPLLIHFVEIGHPMIISTPCILRTISIPQTTVRCCKTLGLSKISSLCLPIRYLNVSNLCGEIYVARLRRVFVSRNVDLVLCICTCCYTVIPNFLSPQVFRLFPPPISFCGNFLPHDYKDPLHIRDQRGIAIPPDHCAVL